MSEACERIMAIMRADVPERLAVSELPVEEAA